MFFSPCKHTHTDMHKYKCVCIINQQYLGIQEHIFLINSLKIPWESCVSLFELKKICSYQTLLLFWFKTKIYNIVKTHYFTLLHNITSLASPEPSTYAHKTPQSWLSRKIFKASVLYKGDILDSATSFMKKSLIFDKINVFRLSPVCIISKALHAYGNKEKFRMGDIALDISVKTTFPLINNLLFRLLCNHVLNLNTYND